MPSGLARGLGCVLFHRCVACARRKKKTAAHVWPCLGEQAATTKLRDQEMLAFACRRANKTRNEALAYYNMGVLHDNDKEYDKANTCYEQYLQVDFPSLFHCIRGRSAGIVILLSARRSRWRAVGILAESGRAPFS